MINFLIGTGFGALCAYLGMFLAFRHIEELQIRESWKGTLFDDEHSDLWPEIKKDGTYNVTFTRTDKKPKRGKK